jgi:hypothetical protein
MTMSSRPRWTRALFVLSAAAAVVMPAATAQAAPARKAAPAAKAAPAPKPDVPNPATDHQRARRLLLTTGDLGTGWGSQPQTGDLRGGGLPACREFYDLSVMSDLSLPWLYYTRMDQFVGSGAVVFYDVASAAKAMAAARHASTPTCFAETMTSALGQSEGLTLNGSATTKVSSAPKVGDDAVLLRTEASITAGEAGTVNLVQDDLFVRKGRSMIHVYVSWEGQGANPVNLTVVVPSVLARL